MRRFILAIGLMGGLSGGLLGNTSGVARAEEIPGNEIPPEKISDSPHCWTVWVCDTRDNQGTCTHGHDEKQCE